MHVVLITQRALIDGVCYMITILCLIKIRVCSSMLLFISDNALYCCLAFKTTIFASEPLSELYVSGRLTTIFEFAHCV